MDVNWTIYCVPLFPPSQVTSGHCWWSDWSIFTWFKCQIGKMMFALACPAMNNHWTLTVLSWGRATGLSQSFEEILNSNQLVLADLWWRLKDRGSDICQSNWSQLFMASVRLTYGFDWCLFFSSWPFHASFLPFITCLLSGWSSVLQNLPFCESRKSHAINCIFPAFTPLISGLFSGEAHDKDVQVVELPIVDSLHPRPPYLPLAIPEDLAPRLHRLHGDPSVWWVSQFVKYLVRPQAWLEKEIQQSTAKLGFKHPIIG